MAMQLTRAGEYAIKSLVYMAGQELGEARVMASEVATAEAIPVNFVRKILESLAKTGLVKSYRGAGGGFILGRDPHDISLLEVVEAVEGPLALNQCLSPSSCANIDACPVNAVWKEAQAAVSAVLARHSVAALARAREAGKAVLL